MHHIHHGDALSYIRTLPDDSVDSIVTDPPYGLSELPAKKVSDALSHWIAGQTEYIPSSGAGMMSARWDRFVPPPALFAECLRVLKPGGHMLVFSAPRTQDLMGLSVRLAGFEIRDSLAWGYGAGMPKTTDASKMIDKYLGAPSNESEKWEGWTTAVKPAHEPILVARKPLAGTVAANLLTYGTGALNVGQTRVPFRNAADEAESKEKNRHADYGTLQGRNKVYGDYTMIGPSKNYDAPGRLPANLILDEPQARQLDIQSGQSRSRKGKPRSSARPGDGWGATKTGAEYDDIGGASRFFHVIDEDPLDDLPSRIIWCPKAPAKERIKVDGTQHPTVKPLRLMRLLVRMVTPPDGVVLDPFGGSGTTAEAALLEGFNTLTSESDERFFKLIDARIQRALDTIHTALEA